MHRPQGGQGRKQFLRSQEAAVPGIARICSSRRGESVEQSWRKARARQVETRRGRGGDAAGPVAFHT